MHKIVVTIRVGFFDNKVSLASVVDEDTKQTQVFENIPQGPIDAILAYLQERDYQLEKRTMTSDPFAANLHFHMYKDTFSGFMRRMEEHLWDWADLDEIMEAAAQSIPEEDFVFSEYDSTLEDFFTLLRMVRNWPYD